MDNACDTIKQMFSNVKDYGPILFRIYEDLRYSLHLLIVSYISLYLLTSLIEVLHLLTFLYISLHLLRLLTSLIFMLIYLIIFFDKCMIFYNRTSYFLCHVYKNL